MRRFLGFFLILGFLIPALSGCDLINNFMGPKKSSAIQKSPSFKVRGTIIGKVGNIPLTLEELNQDVASFNEIVPADQPEKKITTREQKIDYARNQMAKRALLYQEALNRGLDKDDEITSALERTKMELCVIKLLKDETEKTDVTPKEVEDAYNTYKDQLKEPEERNIREIVVTSEQAAKDILVQLLQGGDFATLATV